METINVDIEFDTITDTNINPCIEVFLNEEVCYARTEISINKKINFDLNLQNNQTYKLIINRSNHNNKGKQILIIKS